MEKTDRLMGYLTLSKIQQKAYLRNLWIIGGLLLFTFLSTTATLLFTEWNARSIWVMGLFDALIMISFLMAWTRLEIVRKNIDLVNYLQLRD